MFFQVFFLFPVIVLLAAIYLVAAPFSKTPLPAFFCLLFILCGIPVYFLFIHKNRSPAFLNRGMGKLKTRHDKNDDHLLVPNNIQMLVFLLEKFTYFVQKFADVSYPETEDAIVG